MQEREGEHRLRLATTTEVLGRQWDRAQGLPRGQRTSLAPSMATARSDGDADGSGRLAAALGSAFTGSGMGSTGGFSGLSQGVDHTGSTLTTNSGSHVRGSSAAIPHGPAV